MSRREATADTQCVRAIREQLHVRETAAERHEVPRAVDVRQDLE
jgi:hypothetical protein